jgi:agmatinase
MVSAMRRKSRNFGGLKEPFSDYDGARFAVLPIPYERTTSYMKGTSKGPSAIIEASGYLELYDEELDCNPAEAGIATLKPLRIAGKPEGMVAKVKSAVIRILRDGKTPVILGGEHSITAGSAAAFSEFLGDFSVLQFDAHADLRETYQGSRYSHACALARVREYADTVHVGIRSVGDDESDLVKILRSEGRLFFASDLKGRDCSEEIVAHLKEKIFVTFDVDCLDPSIMPSTGTPEPGGLDWYEVLRILRRVASQREIAGFDIMELMPNRHDRSPDYTAARLAYKIMGYTVCAKT